MCANFQFYFFTLFVTFLAIKIEFTRLEISFEKTEGPIGFIYNLRYVSFHMSCLWIKSSQDIWHYSLHPVGGHEGYPYG